MARSTNSRQLFTGRAPPPRDCTAATSASASSPRYIARGPSAAIRRSVAASSGCTRRQPGRAGRSLGRELDARRLRKPLRPTRASALIRSCSRGTARSRSRAPRARWLASSTSEERQRAPALEHERAARHEARRGRLRAGPTQRCAFVHSGLTKHVPRRGRGRGLARVDACTSPSPVRISTNAPPPSPAEKGCVTASAKAVAIAASTRVAAALEHRAPRARRFRFGRHHHAARAERGRRRRGVGRRGEREAVRVRVPVCACAGEAFPASYHA